MLKVSVPIPYRQAVERYVKKLIRRIKPRAIILYGSVARGRQGVGSDIDILVISEHLPSNFLERLKTLFELNNSTAPIEAVAYTPQEFQHMTVKTHLTALSAFEEGMILYDDGFFQQQKERYNQIKNDINLVRVEGGWERRLKPA
ncbi:MAG: nucleotidyltransferase domain-containing protein [Nitrososphaerales archaeon]